MAYTPPEYDAEKSIAFHLRAAAHWEEVAEMGPASAKEATVDYANHLRTMAECLRMDLLDKGMSSGDGDV
jgi:hypothetical protein